MPGTNTRLGLLVFALAVLTGAWLVAPRLSTAVTSPG
jgi:hypothetical protein